MKPIYCFSNQNGMFVCFNTFQEEDQFEEFLLFIKEKLLFVVNNTQQGPYSIIGKCEYNKNEFTVMFHEDTGCCIRVENEQQVLFDEILEKLRAIGVQP